MKRIQRLPIKKIAINIFQFISIIMITLPIYPQSLSQNFYLKSSLIFQSQFSQNLTKNFQEAKSEGCFVLYDLKCDRFSNIIFI